MTLVHHALPCSGSRKGTLVFLHGLGDSPAGWAFLPSVLAMPDLEIVLVQAPIPYGPGWSWYDFEDPRKGRLDIAESRRMVDELLRELDRPAESTILGGFSQGAVLSLETGLRFPRALAGILAISGYVPLLEDYPAALDAGASRIPALATHGPWDGVLPLEMVRPQMEALVERGVSLTFETFDKAHDLDMEDEVPRIRAWVASRLGIV